MKALGIAGSPRANGNTEIITAHTLKAIGEEGIETELVSLSGLDIRPCNACMTCRSEETCPIDDDLWPVYMKMKDADAIIMASPVYFGSTTALLKALMERTGYIAYNNGRPFDRKVGGPLAVAHHAGQNFTRSWAALCPGRPTGTFPSVTPKGRWRRMKRGSVPPGTSART